MNTNPLFQATQDNWEEFLDHLRFVAQCTTTNNKQFDPLDIQELMDASLIVDPTAPTMLTFRYMYESVHSRDRDINDFPVDPALIGLSVDDLQAHLRREESRIASEKAEAAEKERIRKENDQALKEKQALEWRRRRYEELKKEFEP